MIELLNSHEVRYLVVGGFAVAFHGYPRMTGDIDFLVDRSDENAHRLERVLSDFGFGGLDLTAADFVAPNQVVQLGYPPNRIDLATTISGVNFSEAWSERVPGDIDGIPVHFISKRLLLANKASAGRPKDKADIHGLE